MKMLTLILQFEPLLEKIPIVPMYLLAQGKNEYKMSNLVCNNYNICTSIMYDVQLYTGLLLKITPKQVYTVRYILIRCFTSANLTPKIIYYNNIYCNNNNNIQRLTKQKLEIGDIKHTVFLYFFTITIKLIQVSDTLNSFFKKNINFGQT